MQRVKLVVQFDDAGNPIGANSAGFSSLLGDLSLTHPPIYFHKLVVVPSEKKDLVWTGITDKYDCSGTTRGKVFFNANTYWKNRNSTLRTKHYDKYNTDEERKRKCPKSCRQKDWELFIDLESSDEATLQENKLLVTKKISYRSLRLFVPPQLGTKSIRGMYDGKKYKERNLDVPVTRTHIYLALHANNDGNCSTPAINANIDKIKDTIAANPSSALLDLDHDPLVRVYGVDNNGRVLGFPIGICKRGYLVSAPARIQLQMQKQVVSSVLHQVDAMKSQFDKHGSLISMLASTGGSNTTCGASPSNVCVLFLYYL